MDFYFRKGNLTKDSTYLGVPCIVNFENPWFNVQMALYQCFSTWSPQLLHYLKQMIQYNELIKIIHYKIIGKKYKTVLFKVQ